MPHFLRSLRVVSLALLVLHAAAPAAAQSTQQTSLGGSFGFDTPQIQIANSMNLWKANGIDVTPVSFGSGRAAMEGLIGGQVDFVLAAELPAVTGAMRAQKFAVIADLSRYNDNCIVTTLPVKSVAGLAGQKVGSTIGTSSGYLLDAALHRAGIKAEVVNAAPADLVPALSRGDIVAGSIFSDFIPQAKKVLGDRYHEIRVPEPTHMLLLASRDVLTKRPDVVRSVLAAILRADTIVQKTPSAAQDIVAASTSGSVTTADLRRIWPSYSYEVHLDPSLIDLMTAEGSWIANSGMVKNVSPDRALFLSYVDSDPLRALAANRVSVK